MHNLHRFFLSNNFRVVYEQIILHYRNSIYLLKTVLATILEIIPLVMVITRLTINHMCSLQVAAKLGGLNVGLSHTGLNVLKFGR